VTNDIQSLFVLTCGPGSCKTTLIEALARAGHAGSLEAGQTILHGDSERRQDLEAAAPTTDSLHCVRFSRTIWACESGARGIAV
jgi:predicted ATPase